MRAPAVAERTLGADGAVEASGAGQLPLKVLSVEMTFRFCDQAIGGQTPIFPATYLNPIASAIRS